MVECVVLKREAEGLEAPPHPGEIGRRIYENVSREGWTEWLQRLQMIINENQLNSADPRSLDIIEQHSCSEKAIWGDCPRDFRLARRSSRLRSHGHFHR
jgi:Fe-S cluster biosynthesis and repair protein YggX